MTADDGYRDKNSYVDRSRNYELWKLHTQAWTFVTEMSKEKQALAVSLNLPENDKWKIKE